MTELLDRSIAALRTQHTELEAVVAGLSPEQLNGGSGASEWSIAQVLSHIGSGAEITLGTIMAADQDNRASGTAGTPHRPRSRRPGSWSTTSDS